MYSLFATVTLILITLIVLYSLHFLALLELRKLMPKEPDHHHKTRSLVILMLLMGVHVLEIGWFAGVFYISDQWLNLGGFTLPFIPSAIDYFYQASVTYSTLGMSSFTPIGYLKVISGIFSVVGFVLLTWSATFFFTLFSHAEKKS